MTELDLTPIKARLDAASPGPWSWGYVDDTANPEALHSSIDLVAYAPDRTIKIGYPDATLIASAPADIAALIAEVERLRAEVESLESTLMEDY